jgi:23S rRNA (guanosine2251-2'-O)-methyltransferase
MVIFGFHAIEAMLRADKKVRGIYLIGRDVEKERARELKSLAAESSVSFREFSANERPRYEQEFKRLGGTPEELEGTQGVFAEVPDFGYAEFSQLLAAAKEKEEYPILVFLDSVTDPQNIGAILRSSAFFGVAGLIVTEHRSAPVTGTAIKISSGGFAHVPVAKVVNLVQALEEAKEAGFWVVGLSEHATETFETARLDAPLVLVIGSEDKGIRPLTAKTCDYTLSLPNDGALKSLNAATAAAVTLTLVRERRKNISK